MNHSDLDEAENVSEEVTKCSSSSKRTALARKVRLRSSSDEEESDLNPSKTAKESPLAVQIISDSTDSEMEHSNSDDDHNMAQRRKKRKARTLSDDEEIIDSTPQRPNKCGSEVLQKAKRKLALENLMEKRKHARNDSGIASDQSECNYGNYSPQKQGSNLSDVVDYSQSCKELTSSSLDHSSESDESDMSDFVVEDSQSQDAAEAMSYFYNPSKEELFKRFVETLLCSVVDDEFSDEDPRFQKAKTYWENLVNTKKDQVASTTWREFKQMLMRCPVVKAKPLQGKMMKKCEACLLPRVLSEYMTFYEEPDGEMIKEFKVGCFCAQRGALYHELQHYKLQLKQSCMAKVNKVQGMGIDAPDDIVQHCLNDDKWLDMLFKTFKAPLDSADRWAEDGDKRLHMKKYCDSFFKK